MNMRERLEALVRAATRRPLLTVGIVLAAAIGGGALALGLDPDASPSTFVSRGSDNFVATEDLHKHFGDDAVVILVREPLTYLTQTKDLATLTFLESCLAGQVAVPNEQAQSFEPAPAGSQGPYGGWNSPCGHLMKAKPVQVVYGPGTFLNRAVQAVNDQVQSLLAGMRQRVASARAAAEQLAAGKGLTPADQKKAGNAAAQLEQQQDMTQLAQMYVTSGIKGNPRIDDAQFTAQVVFDQTRGVNQPKARFAYLFPTSDSALMQVRLKPSLTQSQRSQAIGWIRDAMRMPQFALQYGGTYTVSGAPVVANDIAAKMTDSIAVLLLIAVGVMALVLLIVFRGRLRLLPLAIALAATGITFGVMSLAGASLTMASIAVLPILIGLAVDYAIQFQSRAREASMVDGQEQSTEIAVARAASLGAPTLAAAALATAVGFLVLLLSPVPMVRGFGLLLVIGIGIALLCALTAGSAALVLADRDGGRFGASLRGAGEIIRDLVRPLAASAKRVTTAFPSAAATSSRFLSRYAVRRPTVVLAVAGALALAGWVADTQTAVQSDITKLVPADMPALRDLHKLEQVTGVSGEIDITVRGADVTSPQVVGWMTGYEQRLLAHYGYLESRGCASATLCPALSLPDLFCSSAQAGNCSSSLTQASIQSLLATVPEYFSQAVITHDHREATLAFGIRLMPLSKQQRVIDYMRSQLHPPRGITARLAGLPVLAAQADSALSSSARRLVTLVVGLLAVGLTLFGVFRRPERSIVPLVPIVLATGWSALILFATDIPLNPMSATLGVLVVAISTEFSVLLSERFRQERAAGYMLWEALERTYRFTGVAVLASGATAIAGFGVVAFSNITMLRDFGLVTLVDLTVSLCGVLLVLPAVLAFAERGEIADTWANLLRAARSVSLRRRRRPRVAAG